eukprot:gene7060-14364_t
MSSSSTNSPNLWETILRESSKKTRSPEGTVIFCGNKGCAKEKIIEKFCVTEANGVRPKTEVLSYDFFHAVDPSENDGPVDLESVNRVNLWSLSNLAFYGALEVVLNPSKVEKLVLVIGVDLSKPDECCDDLRKWLHKANIIIQSFINKMSTENKAVLLDSNLSYIKNIRFGMENSADNNTTVNEKPMINLGVPIVIIGCNSECLQVEDINGMKRAKDLQGELRCICMEVGAALLYASSQKDSDCSRIQKYLLHRLYPETVSIPMQIHDGLNDVFIPAGLETTHLIRIATDINPSIIPSVRFDNEEQLPLMKSSTVNDNSSSTSTTSPPLPPSTDTSMVELEDEQVWLASLQTYIEQVVASAVPIGKQTSSTNLDMKTNPITDTRTTKPRAAARPPAQGGDHSNLPTEELKNFFENLLTNNNPPPKKN